MFATPGDRTLVGGNAMTGHGRIDRRQILKGAGAIGIGALAALAPATALANEGELEGLVGSWNAPHTAKTGPFAGPPTDGNITFAPGGALAANDSDSPATGLGNWTKHGEHGFRFTFHTFIFNPSVPHGSKVKVRAQGTLDGDAIRGQFSFDVFGPDGNAILGLTGSGTFQGTRIRIQAP
jgi:hypothetical protein